MPDKTFVNSRVEMEDILGSETLGFLGLCKDGRPYVVPLTYAYVNGKILFHCATEGQKLAYIRANPRVCFTVGRQFSAVSRHAENKCEDNHASVICYGVARILTDETEKWEALNAFSRALQPGAEPVSREAAAACCAVEINIAEMTGRRQQGGADRCYFTHSFPD